MINLLCPICHQPLNKSYACLSEHAFAVEDGVLVLLTPGFRQILENFTAVFSQVRAAAGLRLEDPSIFPQLPAILRHNPEWRMRGYDLTILEKLLAGRMGRVLDVGAWNGWLSYWLTQKGWQVTAVDYFTDPFDGLRAQQFYPAQWQSIQMDLTDLSILGHGYDVVILNRCIAFYADPVAYLLSALPLLKPGGVLVATGLSFFRDSTIKAESVAAFRRHLQSQGLDFFKPMKGYLDFKDKARLSQAGITLKPYPQLAKANLKSLLLATSPRYYYAYHD